MGRNLYVPAKQENAKGKFPVKLSVNPPQKKCVPAARAIQRVVTPITYPSFGVASK